MKYISSLLECDCLSKHTHIVLIHNEHVIKNMIDTVVFTWYQVHPITHSHIDISHMINEFNILYKTMYCGQLFNVMYVIYNEHCLYRYYVIQVNNVVISELSLYPNCRYI